VHHCEVAGLQSSRYCAAGMFLLILPALLYCRIRATLSTLTACWVLSFLLYAAHEAISPVPSRILMSELPSPSTIAKIMRTSLPAGILLNIEIANTD
jgi:hypothetical protein